jgi:hypothetical protein
LDFANRGLVVSKARERLLELTNTLTERLSDLRQPSSAEQQQEEEGEEQAFHPAKIADTEC